VPDAPSDPDVDPHVAPTQLQFTLPAATFNVAPGTAVRLKLVAGFDAAPVDNVNPGEYELVVFVVPASPVKAVTVQTTVTNSRTDRATIAQPAGGGGWRVNSWSDCRNHDDSHTFAPDPGWQIDTATVAVHIIRIGYAPRSSARVDVATANSVTVSGHTVANCLFGISSDSGDITYSLSYDEVRTVPVDSLTTINVPIAAWGAQADVPVKAHAWTAHVVLWDGTTRDYSAAASDNPYLTITDGGPTIHFSAATLASIASP
jgi:hypothetical protein